MAESTMEPDAAVEFAQKRLESASVQLIIFKDGDGWCLDMHGEVLCDEDIYTFLYYLADHFNE